MKKKFILCLALMTIAISGIFAQNSGAKHWISGELSLLGGGLRYEYTVKPTLTIGANFYGNWLPVVSTFGMSFNVRYYFTNTSNIGKYFFIEGGLGWTFVCPTLIDNDFIGIWGLGTLTGVAIIPAMGAKIKIDKVKGFYVQPGLKIPVTIGAHWGAPKVFGVGVGVILYCGLGYYF